MDFKTFTDFGTTVFNHNFEQQKQLEQDGIFTLEKLNSYLKEYPLAEIYLHYPSDEQAENLQFCYSMNGEGPVQLLPVLSAYADDNKIVLSYLRSLDGVDLSESLPTHGDYLNSIKLQSSLAKRNSMFVQDNHMIFMEHIPDSLKWTSENSHHKIHQAFSFLGVSNYMLWSAFYFTPHY